MLLLPVGSWHCCTSKKAADTVAVPTSKCTAMIALSNMINKAVVEAPAKLLLPVGSWHCCTSTKAANTVAVPTSKCTIIIALSNMINEAVVEAPAHPA